MRITGKYRTGALLPALAALAALALLLPAGAQAKTRWVVKGAGWGHGIGMSQWGAYGLAKRGSGYREILAHYYTGTAIESAPSRRVRVLLRGGAGRIEFSNATKACGRNLDVSATYAAVPRGSRVALVDGSGRRLRNCGVLRARGRGTVRVSGLGSYRGLLEVRRSGGGLNAINAVSLEHYVMGVIANESPSSWPAEALKAQAVAARTYAITTSKNGDGFDQYSDTRSQVYRGRGSETAATNRAVRATRREAVTYRGEPAVTFFFSSSGGRTEHVESAWPSAPPQPWLKSVSDPHDSESPNFRWTMTFSQRAFNRALGDSRTGSLRRVVVLKRGVSPRIVRARIEGTRGSKEVTGSYLQARLGLRSTWARFQRTSSDSDIEVDIEEEPAQPPPESGGTTAS